MRRTTTLNPRPVDRSEPTHFVLDSAFVEAGIATVRPRTTNASRVVTVIAVVVPPLGLVSAAGLLWGVAVRPLDLVLLVGFYGLGAVGVTVGFHRHFAHRSFETTPSVRAVLAVLGCMAMQGPLTQWVTDHRKHHALSDREGDPHSPHLHDGVLGGLRGFAHAHISWLFSSKGMERGRDWGRDLYEDRLIRAIDRLYLVWVVLTIGLPFTVGLAWGGPAVGFEAMIWGGLLRIFLFQHATFSVNSICHLFGTRPYRSRDESRNNAVVALFTLGEGWHNNHHAFPSSARHGLGRGQLDLAWLVIRGLELLGLAWNVRRPDPRGLAARQR